VAKEVGTEGILGGQADVKGVSGTWKDLTDNVNFMANNLTNQVRNIALVTTAVANGDLSKEITVDARGEILELKNTVNTMVDQLNSFAAEVTRVAREVGAEGKLGGQANVPNVAGTWKDLTDNVNFMANSLTVQVRAISEVATAVTEGDLTRTIRVEAQGEVDALKNNLNQMIDNLRETTQQNQEQDFLKTNLARFSRMMQGQKNLQSVARLIMSEVTPLVSAHHGAFYINEPEDALRREPMLKLLSSYAFQERKNLANRFREGEGLIGQCALEKKSIILTEVPDNYIQISSGLGQAPPLSIIVLPILFEGEIMAVMELASFQRFSEIHRTFLDQLAESIGVVINMIQANMRTEELLEQSQSLTQELQSQSQELQSQQDQLRRTNVELESQAKELEEKATLLEVQNTRVEQKNREVELARLQLEEKAEQLAHSFKYKSEFLANMSHELRTPLNSMLILAKLLSDNTEGNMTPKQTEFATTIHSSGHDLLNLINDILDLSKVEAGKMEIVVTNVALSEVSASVQRNFAHLAEQKNLDFKVSISPRAPRSIETDATRLQQVLKNLLSNAFKFTTQGSVTMQIEPRPGHMLAFAVHDTGIGIARDKQNLIFEAFQQADGTTSRKFGGTGLGLSISREITRLLGGRIEVESAPGQGSVFTLLLPVDFQGDPNALLDELNNESDSFNDGFSDGFGDGFNNAVSDGVRDGVSESFLNGFSDEADESESARTAATATTAGATSTAEVQIVTDDRDEIEEGDHVLLIMEDDPTFAQILLDTARSQGFKGVVALQGDQGIELARQLQPSAISLDLKMPVVDGWTVLDQLKRDPQTRHIPVQVVSVINRNRGTLVSAIAYLEKPVSREALEGAFQHIKQYVSSDIRNLLLVEDDEAQRQGVVELLTTMNVQTEAVATGEEALAQLDKHPFDCMILDLGLPDMEGFELLKKIKKREQFADLPVVIYTSKDLSRREEAQLKKYASAIITKTTGSAERLLEETSLFLHRVLKTPGVGNESQVDGNQAGGQANTVRADSMASSMASGQMLASKAAARKGKGKPKGKAGQAIETNVADGASSNFAELSGQTVLVVDDDMRNIFALTSVLESQGVNVVFAENGRDGIEVLKQNQDISLVLMDVMMPEMDGYETMRAIRRMEQYVQLPIIALTAKVLSGDREKCIEAGATDYIPKPVDINALLLMMRRLLSVASTG
jgi:signal transduction histidine kinase/CheY-like chemotaxis protein/HAMP domain-containing protein